MQGDDARREHVDEERARKLAISAAVILLCFVAGLVLSLQGVGVEIAPAGPVDSLQPRTIDGVITYVRVDDGGHAVACSTTYSSSKCSTVGVVLSRRSASK